MLQFVRFKHLQTGVTRIMFMHNPNGWRSHTGVVMSEEDWEAIGWVMVGKEQEHNEY